ncbi:acyltransferase family protein [Devosia psychrophila]|uniref:acyltransferase family protein n=1 Tax=Devosia psychrophila TaxID=728005 RepID=UPI00244E9DD4|nr:acyltransferase [Devosia psychrophila]
MWADAVKGMAIVLVVFGHVLRGDREAGLPHSEQWFNTLDSAVYLVHIPMFFVVSGYFFERSVLRDGLLGSLKKRAIVLLYPLLVWSYITATFRLAAGSVTNRGAITPWEVLTYPFVLSDVYWFLWALFVIQTVVSFVVPFAKRRPATYLTLAAVAFGLQFIAPPSVYISSALHHLPNFIAGILLARWLGEKQLRLFMAFPALLIFALCEFLNISFNFGYADLTQKTVLELLAAVSLIVAIQCIYRSTARGQMAWLGALSMPIFVAHVIPAAAARIVLMKLGIEFSAVHLVIETAVGVLVPILLYVALSRMNMVKIAGLGPDLFRTGQRLVPEQAAFADVEKSENQTSTLRVRHPAG